MSIGPAIGTPDWIWYKTQQDVSLLSQVTDKTSIGSGDTYTVKQSDVGFWIWVELTYSGNTRTIDSYSQRISPIDIPSTATVSVSMRAEYYPSYSSDNHYVTVTLTLSAGKWNDWADIYSPSQWITMSGTPSVSSWYTSGNTSGGILWITYSTRSDTTLPISNLTATLNTSQLSTMRSNTNVYNTLTAGTTTASVSQWTMP